MQFLGSEASVFSVVSQCVIQSLSMLKYSYIRVSSTSGLSDSQSIHGISPHQLGWSLSLCLPSGHFCSSLFNALYFNYSRNSSGCVLLPLVEINLPLPPMSQLLRAKVMVHKVIVHKVIVVVMGKFRT